MKRQDFEKAVWDSDLNPYARLVLLTYAGAADYRDVDQEVWLSKAKVSHRTGLHPDTVKKYVDALVADGWLIPSKMYGRAQGFHLATGRVTEKQVMDRSRASNLSPNRQEIESPNHQETQDGLVEEVSPNGAALSPNGAVYLSPNGAGGISYPLGTNNQEHPYKDNNQEEPRKTETSQAPSPFDKDEEELSMEQPESTVPLLETGPGTGLDDLPFLDKDERDNYKFYVTKKRWTPERAWEQILYNREEW